MNLSDTDSSSDGFAESQKHQTSTYIGDDSPEPDSHSRADESYECPIPAKRSRTNTYGASSTTSPDTDSDDEQSENAAVDNYSVDHKRASKIQLKYQAQSIEDDIRLSRSSVSEACSSPNDHFDEFRPTLGNNDTDNEDEDVTRPTFHLSDNTFYNKKSDKTNEDETTNRGGYSDTVKNIKSNKGVNLGKGLINKPNEDETAIKGGYSDTAKRMMSNMGFKPGKGLGKFEHGRVEPVEASAQKGRRGLGLKPSTVGDVPADFMWSPDAEKSTAEERVSWIASKTEPLPGDILEEWLKKGPRKLTINDETDFVKPSILKGVLDSKTIFDSLDDEDLRQARYRSNPYETIGSVIFLNRAAVKMANLDAIFDFMFTNLDSNGKPIDMKDILYFADVCAGPGGFSEYVLYRRGWKAKGFGFTLKGSNDFKLSDFYAGTPETFNPYYGTEGNGDIFNPENLTSLKENVLKHTVGKGVDFLMADGGFSVEGQENIQEILSKQLYLCQCLAALMLVKTSGHFVVKLFDVFTLFSVGLIYIMYKCFDQVCIHKPVTSRPANSERYLVCKSKKLNTEPTESHLYFVNSILWRNRDQDQDVTQLVPLNVILEDSEFFEYVYDSNCRIGDKQIKNLLKIAKFSKDKSLREECQAEMREKCLKLWKIPDEVRKQPERPQPDGILSSMFSLMKKMPPECHDIMAFKSNVLNHPPEYLEQPSVLETFKNVYDWHFMFLASVKKNPELGIFLGCGGKQVWQLDGTKWKNLSELHLVLPPKTLIYGEIVKEYTGEGKTQQFSKALHIIDAMMLGGVDVSHMTLTERIKQCGLFCTALHKPFDQPTLPMRCKKSYDMENFMSALGNLEHRAMKRGGKAVTLDIPNRIDREVEMFHTVGSLIFIKEVKEPWMAQMSKSTGFKYFFKPGKDKKSVSEYHLVSEARLDMINAYSRRVMWPWNEFAIDILNGKAANGLSVKELGSYIQNNIKR